MALLMRLPLGLGAAGTFARKVLQAEIERKHEGAEQGPGSENNGGKIPAHSA
jgi:hypothetical protein